MWDLLFQSTTYLMIFVDDDVEDSFDDYGVDDIEDSFGHFGVDDFF